MGNVNMEATQINDRTGASKMSVAQHLKALDAIASAIEGLPTFTSNDRAFLEELPAFPSEDGKKALVATTESGETSLNYEEIEEGGGVDYSTTEQTTGQKWIDGKDIYVRSWDFGEDVSISNTDWTNINILSAGFDKIIEVEAVSEEGGFRVVNLSISEQYVRALAARANGNFGMRYITLYYTKTT